MIGEKLKILWIKNDYVFKKKSFPILRICSFVNSGFEIIHLIINNKMRTVCEFEKGVIMNSVMKEILLYLLLLPEL